MAQAPESDAPAKGIDPQRYRDVMGRFVTGVTVVTTLENPDANDSHPWGTTVNSFTAVSLDPPLVLVAIGRERSIHPIIERTRRFAVNILGEGTQAISDCFAGRPVGAPALSLLRCRLRAGRVRACRYSRRRSLTSAARSSRSSRPATTRSTSRASSRQLRATTRAGRCCTSAGATCSIERAATADLRGKPDRVR